MAKSAKDKLAVDGTPKLAAKSKPSDKHEKKNLSIEEATVESPRASRKRAGEFFDFGDEADRVAEGLAGDGAKADGKAGASKAKEPTKKAKTAAAQDSAMEDSRKGKASKDESLEDSTVAKDAKKSKSKKAVTSDKDVAAGSTSSTAAQVSKATETDNKAKKGQGKKADKDSNDTADTTKASDQKADTVKKTVTEVKKGKSKKADTAKNPTGKEETIEDRVVAEDAKKQKTKKASETKKDVVNPSDGTAAGSQEAPMNATKPTKSKTTKDSTTTKAKASGAKDPEKDLEKPSKKDKSASSKASKDVDKNPTKSKVTDEDEAKEKPKNSKVVKESAPVEHGSSTKQSKAQAKTNAGPGGSKPASAGKAKGETKTSAREGKVPKSKAKHDTEKQAKGDGASNPAKKGKDGEAVQSKKTTVSDEATKPKKAAKAKDNKPDIPDQAIQPMDLVKEGAALNELSKTEPSKGKKRKASSGAAVDTVKSNILDPLSEHATGEVGEESAKKKQKKSRKSLGETLGEIVASSADAVRKSFTGVLGGGVADGKPNTIGSSHKQSKDRGKATDEDDPQPTVNEDEEENEEDDTPDAATAALLASFESDDDDVHPPGDAGFKENGKVPPLPDSTITFKKLNAIKGAEDGKPGVVYVGRIPHGFYEHEMRTYFSQFGDINRLRLSRSAKTGHSKHFAFLEFENQDVAKIVAETMDNYLMFGHILKCKVVAPEDVHESMWRGANRRFKRVPWNKIEGQKLEMPVSREMWKKREEKTIKKRAEKSKKMMETVGYAYEGTGLKSVDSIPKKIFEATTTQEKSLVTGPEVQDGSLVVSEEIKGVKVKKGAQVAAQTTGVKMNKTGKPALQAGGEVVAPVTKKARKASTNGKA